MGRTKIDYGIDLGTTNSAISRMENGEAVIKKSEGFQMDTTPSCVHFNKKKTIQVGTKASNMLDRERKLANSKNDGSIINGFQEFKRTMGTDEGYESSNMGKTYSSEELSSEVLKALKGYVRDEEINAAVITVPAKFQGYQNDATQKAAEMAGFKKTILLQEPVAASMAYGIDSNSMDGQWLVFDFGGGTFDVALMKASEGIMKVIDTAGDNRLGGKNLDLAIVDRIIIPYLDSNFSISEIMKDEDRKMGLRNALKSFAEDTKINLSPANNLSHDILTDEPIGEDGDGIEIEIDLTITKDDYEGAVKPIFQRAIDLSNELLKNNNVSGSELKTVLMIGGPTFSETLRNMIRDQISDKLDVSIDPMTAVAQGASLYASTQDLPEEIRVVDKSNVQLKVNYQSNTVETDEKVGLMILRDKTEGEIPETFFTEIKRNDKGWSSGKIELKGDAEIIDIILEPGKSNGFEIVLFDSKGTEFPCEPNSFSIIQGFKTPGATLPTGICIDVFERSKGKQLLTDVKGLSKNQPLPAKGNAILKTPKDIRPGNRSDFFTIPIYEADTPGIKAIHNFDGLQGYIKVTGDQLPGMLPKDSDVELLIKIDQNRDITVSASFPYLDDFEIEETIKKTIRKMPDKEELQSKLKNARDKLSQLEDDTSEINQGKINEQRKVLDDLENSLIEGSSEADTREEIFGRLNGVLIDLDKLEVDSEWPNVMEELNDNLDRLIANMDQFEVENGEVLLNEYQTKVKEVIEKKDIRMAKDLNDVISQINFKIIEKGAGVALEINIIKNYEDGFSMHEWSNKSQARQLINDAKSIISSNRSTRENLRPIVQQLYSLLPKPNQPISEGGDVLEQ